jgi:hypothetical protein
MNHSRNITAINERVHSCNGADGNSFFMKSPDVPDVSPRQFRSAMEFAGLMIGAPLPFHIMDIVSLRTEEQMLRIDAESVIAMMANADSTRNVSAENLPRDTMSQLWFSLKTDGTISAAAASRAEPHMAAVWPIDVDFSHESFGGCNDIKSTPWAPCLHAEHYGSTVSKNQ